MKELREYRLNLIDRLEKTAGEFREACLATDDPSAPIDENRWSVHQIAAHTRDVDQLVYGRRVRRTATEENPEFPTFDGNAYMTENYDPGESLEQLLDGFVESVRGLTEFLRALPEPAWSRLSRHTTLGGELTLQSWVEKDLAHIREHLESVKKAPGM